MSTAYFVAATISAAAGYRAASHPDMPFWRRWDAGLLAFCVAPIYILHAVAGVGVAAVAVHAGWVPLKTGAGHSLANGAAYGIAAAAFLRLELTSFGLSTVQPSKQLMKIGLEGLATRLNRGATIAVDRTVGDLHGDDLRRVSWRLYERHIGGLRPVTPGVVAVAQWLRRMQEPLAGSRSVSNTGDADLIEAEEALRAFCVGLIVFHKDADIDIPSVTT